MSARKPGPQSADMTPENIARVTKLLEEAHEVMTICRDCGVDTNDMIGQVSHMKALFGKIVQLHHEGKLHG